MSRKRNLTSFELRSQFRKNKNDISLWLKKNKPCIIGLDISTTNTGVYLFPDYAGYLISTAKDESRVSRINTIKIKLKHLLDQYTPNVAAIEDYSLSLRGSSLSQCAEASGVIRDLLYEYNIPVFSIAPTTLKKFVLGQGKTSQAKGVQAKSLVLLRTFTNWGFQFENEHICDAFCAAKFLQQIFAYVTGEIEKPKWLVSHLNAYIQKRGDSLST